MKRTAFSHEFVEFIPSELKEGTLYISIPYAIAVHLCACGCRIKVVTPITPPEWRLTWDGDTISLSPSIGNFQFPCRSHYWVTRNQVRWSHALTEEEIAEGRRRDTEELEAYYAGRLPPEPELSRAPSPRRRTSSFKRLRRLLRLP